MWKFISALTAKKVEPDFLLVAYFPLRMIFHLGNSTLISWSGFLSSSAWIIESATFSFLIAFHPESIFSLSLRKKTYQTNSTFSVRPRLSKQVRSSCYKFCSPANSSFVSGKNLQPKKKLDFLVGFRWWDFFLFPSTPSYSRTNWRFLSNDQTTSASSLIHFTLKGDANKWQCINDIFIFFLNSSYFFCIFRISWMT